MNDTTFLVKVEKLAAGGEGIAFAGGKAIFIPFSIPGETIRIRPIKETKDYIRAEIIDILTPSTDRTVPECPLFGICGGCSLQHIEYTAQLKLKAEAARESFVRIGKFDPGPLPMHSAKPYHYRNRAQFHLTIDGGIGFMKADSDEAVRADSGCPILKPAIDTWLKGQNRKAKPAQAMKLYIDQQTRFIAFADDTKVYIEGKDRTAHVVLARRGYRFPVKHFFQSNLAMAEKLIQDLELRLPGTGEHAVDLYAGAGLFSKLLAERFSDVFCVENDTVSLEAARENCSGHGTRFFPMDVETWVSRELSRTGKSASSSSSALMPAPAEASRLASSAIEASFSAFDCVIADPPRQGLPLILKTWLTSTAIKKFFYVSCDHVTLARDIGALIKNGWEIESLELYDFYPQTGHLESLAVLRPAMNRAGIEA